MNILSIENICFRYEEQPIFADVCLQVKQGELLCLMGPNGCGKSTLLDCVLGILKPQSGTIEIDGQPLSSYKPSLLAKKLAYVPQIHDRSFPYQVIQIVLMGRTAHMGSLQTPGPQEEALALHALESVGIDHLALRPYTQISGGEMQLVMLARALVQETPLIVMDEPTAHLDYKNELLFMETVVHLLAENKVSVLMATHSPNQAFYFENQKVNVTVALMRKGDLYLTGTPKSTLTEESIKVLYQIDSRILTQHDPTAGILRQIVPLKTMLENRKGAPHDPI